MSTITDDGTGTTKITILYNYFTRIYEIPIPTCGTQSNLLQEISNISIENNDINRVFELRSWDQRGYPLRGQLIFITAYVTPPISYNTYRRGWAALSRKPNDPCA